MQVWIARYGSRAQLSIFVEGGGGRSHTRSSGLLASVADLIPSYLELFAAMICARADRGKDRGNIVCGKDAVEGWEILS
jgi:hypothetical protein